MDYCDTSALVKLYVKESYSDEFESWLVGNDSACVTPLVELEFASTVNRRVRNATIAAAAARSLRRQFAEDVERETFFMLPWAGNAFALASRLLDEMPDIPLRTLDALHLAAARLADCSGFATADRVQAEAARALHFQVFTFFDPS